MNLVLGSTSYFGKERGWDRTTLSSFSSPDPSPLITDSVGFSVFVEQAPLTLDKSGSTLHAFMNLINSNLVLRWNKGHLSFKE